MLIRHAWLAALLSLGALLTHPRAGATEFMLDPSRTVVAFEMRSMGTLQRGEFRHTAGTVTLDSAAERGELAIVIDARSLQARNAATTRFVCGPAMLDTAAHPEIAYRAQHIVFSHGKPARIEGELTLLGVTRSVPLHVSSYDCSDESAAGDRCAIVATAHVKRSAFGMTRYMLFASDDVKLAIQAEGVTR
ncbi:MAG TPA: YceI family protein [Steroidobacteraceae bacterium]|nr:YceI family protein [Steroidobacteraceae bacterium]